MGLESFVRTVPGGVLINVYIQPKASRNELTGIHEGSLKIRLTAPPVEGAANMECVRFLSKLLEVPGSKIEIVQGHRSRRKTILIHGLSVEDVDDVFKRKGIACTVHV